jgi:hypothetical protein
MNSLPMKKVQKINNRRRKKNEKDNKNKNKKAAETDD